MRIFCTIILNLIFSVQAGQETWGGDISSLKFVKAGRIFVHENQNTKSCELRKLISANSLQKIVDTTEVESTDSDKTDASGYIYFHKLKWETMSQQMKNEIVLKRYLAQAKIEISDEEAVALVKKCSQSIYWSRNSNVSHGDLITTDAELKKNITHVSQLLLVDIKKGKIKKLPPEFKHESLEKLINTLKFYKKNKKELSVDSTPIAFKFQNGMLKDGKNIKDDEYKEIIINKSMWSYQTLGQKKEFLFHEYLGLLNIRETRYQYSSLLFFDLDEVDYKK
tara:strand:- start:3244 stop:4083 length:840 start_codon:yes stop_codon:yes gene_type:complete